MYKAILVAYDGSTAAAHAFHSALELAERLGASLSVVSVAQLPEPPTMVETTAILDAAKTHYEKDFKRLRADAKARAIELQTHVAVGHAADQIIHHAVESKADLIVMGHRGGSRMKEWLLGSVSKRVLSYAPCSVLIVR
jgi:nucleotide-binding universal stress UspA family protein